MGFETLLNIFGLSSFRKEDPNGFYSEGVKTDGKIEFWDFVSENQEEEVAEVYSATATICGNTIYANSKGHAKKFLKRNLAS